MQHHLLDELAFIHRELLNGRCAPVDHRTSVRVVAAVQTAPSLDGYGEVSRSTLFPAPFLP
jgi:hypothetical protein